MPSVKLMLLGAVPELYSLYAAEDGFPEAHRRTLDLESLVYHKQRSCLSCSFGMCVYVCMYSVCMMYPYSPKRCALLRC